MTDHDTDHSPVALAEPPAPPSGPPKAPAATGEAPRPGGGRFGIGALIALVVLAVAMLGVVVWLVLGALNNRPVDDRATQAAFESAMRKAGTQADYPGEPIDLKAVRPTGSHSFSATFTPDEVAALVNTFRFTSDVGGTQIAVRDLRLEFPAEDTVRAKASVMANGSTYSGDATLDVRFETGRFKSAGVSALTVEGINANEGQKALVADALINYANNYLKNAPGLTLVSVKVTSGGAAVSGMAPDALTYQK